MEPKELRIGNYIISGNNGKYDSDGSIGKVLEVGNEDREFEQIYCECKESFEWFFKGNYFGIPLTEEWLFRLGFEKVKDNFITIESYHYENKNCWIYLIDEGFELELNTLDERHNLVRTYKYVHQLQNLYFALTGEELTIKSK